MDQAAMNLRWAWHLVDTMASVGLCQAVISPGSRSTPLALACERHPGLATWIQVDERCAAFFALGLARAGQRPVALIATSGSAPAHWHPAVIEANHSAIPLLLLSADRPPELQDCGANQTTNQKRLFGNQVRGFHQVPLPLDQNGAISELRRLVKAAVAECLGTPPGPVHLNIPFREPLVPLGEIQLPDPEPADKNEVEGGTPSAGPDVITELAKRISGKPGLILCGPENLAPSFPEAVTGLAQRLAVPILADPLSNLRFGPHDHQHLVARYDSFLRRHSPHSSPKPDWLLRFGAFPLSKALETYLGHCDQASHFLVDAHGRYRDPLHLAKHCIQAEPAGFCVQLGQHIGKASDGALLHAFREQERQAGQIAADTDCLEALAIGQCIRQLPADSSLFCANSLPIRDFDSFSGTGEKTLRIHANRGISGIDGNLSTLLGLASAQAAGITLGLIGDLACYHDMNALLMARQQKVIIVLFNNDGGGIFSHLPQVGLAEFERGWRTPTGLDFGKVAGLYGLAYQKTGSADAFSEALTAAIQRDRTSLIEVGIDIELSLGQHRGYWNHFQ